MIHYDKKDETSFAIGTTLSFEALLRKGDKVHRVYVSPKQERDSTYDKLKQLCLSLKIPLIENNEKIFSSADKENVMVIAEFAKFETPLDPKKNHVVLVHPSNMGNLGTIMRSSAAFTAGGLAIIRPAADAFDPKTIRSSMGAIFSLPFAYFDTFEDYLKQAGTRHLYPFMLQAETGVKEAKKEKPYSLIFGNEATGLDPSYLNVGTPLIIPQSSSIDSLNLDNAVSIALFAFLD
ncbi:MAG: TrmH family RNA methyltransferase [Bacilli bacterium]